MQSAADGQDTALIWLLGTVTSAERWTLHLLAALLVTAAPLVTAAVAWAVPAMAVPAIAVAAGISVGAASSVAMKTAAFRHVDPRMRSP